MSLKPRPASEDPRAKAAHAKLNELFSEVLAHSGFGELRVDIKWLKRGQKEIVISCAKQHRFIVEVDENAERAPGGVEPKGG